MAATRADVDWWIKTAKKKKSKYIISVCDTFDWSDYPVYVSKDENLEKIKAKYDGIDMQKINEVIELDSRGNVKKKR